MAAAFSPPPSNIALTTDAGGVVNNYSYSPNGSGGVNYFLNGQPITNSQYGKATGVDYNALEQFAGQQYQASQSTPSNAAPTGGATGSGTNDPNAVSYYTDLINQLTSQLTGAQQELPTVEGNINAAYDRAVNQENQSESAAESQLATAKQNNATSRESNIGSINMNANSTFNSLMRLLGSSGAAVSSAATTGVPYAVSQNASGQRQGANTAFNTNETAINASDTTQKQQYQNALDDLLNQKNSNLSSADSGILQEEGQLAQQIGSAQINRAEYGGESYADAAKGAGSTTATVQNIQDSLNKLFQTYAQPDIKPTPVSVTVPNPTTYSVDPTVTKAATQAPSTDTSFLPYLTQINQPNLLTGANTTPAPAAGGAK